MSNAQTQSKFVDTFGEHEVEGFAYRRGLKVINLVEPELHTDGSYTLHLNAGLYAKSLDDQWYGTPEGVLDAHDDGDFLSITDHVEAEEVAAAIADDANAEIQRQYVEEPAMPIAEYIDDEYLELYDTTAPEFVLKIHGEVDVVEIDDLMDYWEENRDED